MSARLVVESMWGKSGRRGRRRAWPRPGRGGGRRGGGAGDGAGLGRPAVVGGPTHAFSMSRTSTREDAVQRGARPGHEARGIREWLQAMPLSHHLDVATFDTRVSKVKRLPGSAAKAAAKECDGIISAAWSRAKALRRRQ